MPTEAQMLAAAKALLTTAGAKPYTLQEIEDASKPPAYYTEVSVYQRLGTGPGRARPAESSQWRILVRAVGQLYVNAQLMRANAAALHEATLTVDGETFYVERSVSDDPIGPDDGWWSGTSEFTC